MSKTVRILNDNKVTEIPASELAPGYIRVKRLGIEGEVFMDMKDIDDSIGELRHPPFDAQTRKLIKEFSEIFATVMPMTVKKWEDNFRMDAHPEREIAIWKSIAAAYLHFTGDKTMSDEAKKDYFAIVISCVNNGCDAALEVVNLRKLSKARARGVVREIRELFTRGS